MSRRSSASFSSRGTSLGAGSILVFQLARLQFVVPLAVELVRVQSKIAHLSFRDLNAGSVFSGVELGLYAQARGGAGVPDQLDERFERSQWLAPPVLRDVTEEPMLDLVPLARPWRKVTDSDAQPSVVGEPLQFVLPRQRTVPVASPRVRRDEEVRGFGYAHRPIIFHHCRIEATANLGVSWSRPTLTHASLRAMS